jgi:hypothetical protein
MVMAPIATTIEDIVTVKLSKCIRCNYRIYVTVG